MKQSLTPLDPPYAADVAAMLDKYPKSKGYLLTLFRVFANSARFVKKGVPNLLDDESPLPLHIREIVILRTTANKGCEYEWGVHVTIFAKKAGLSEAALYATVHEDATAPCWEAKEQNLIAAIDEFCRFGRLTEDVKATFEENWSKEQQLEILALIGAYHTISFVANLSSIEGEAFAARFPAKEKAELSGKV